VPGSEPEVGYDPLGLSDYRKKEEIEEAPIRSVEKISDERMALEGTSPLIFNPWPVHCSSQPRLLTGRKKIIQVPI